MEALLDLYAKPYHSDYPVVCLDESGKELTKTAKGALPLTKGQPVRQDYEYVHHGMRNLFVAVEPKGGWRAVRVTERKTGREYAQFLKWLVDEAYPLAKEIQLVQDNLSTHSPASLYRTFEPEEARRLAGKIRFHYTPAHGSWLNMAEIEIGVFARQCWKGRIEDAETLSRRVAALVAERNAAQTKINWQFTCAKARVTFQRFYSKLTNLS